ncbi:TetR family transcriptional regulator [Mycolicibacterium neworleansense]|uniref:TetR family transcriptional regulator n=1 Tax=Mycolicibacterium neworleansense TaxID=146018 RepID=A0A0H5RUK3_9MYCO|nr:TetR family transcriptional regulator [Mycolicibacterium neworleansense]
MGVPAAGRYAKGEVKRAEIKVAALAVLERDGEAGASMRVIAKEAGISLAGLMHYFPTRTVVDCGRA